MVGHTGDLEATKKACEVVDAQVGMLLKAVEELGGVFLLTADHGNADDMVQREKKTNKPVMQDGKIATLTSHTLAPVPVAIGGPGLPASVRFRDDLPVRLRCLRCFSESVLTPGAHAQEAGLANITATYLNLMGFQTPSNMEPSLLASA